MDDHEEVIEQFDGAKLVWASIKTTVPKTPPLSYLHATGSNEKRHELWIRRRRKRRLWTISLRSASRKSTMQGSGRLGSGYLLYGPPGTSKLTMIAAIANFLNYDVYDLELTAVKNNTDLRKLLIETPCMLIIVIT
ncbi:AAA-ATPase [Camellia lanceoleosa]|uniref:AAA-ATPase n=1 Tax=Camellia lanceoleosa TaxID=1840588 RepID=A0ACC0IYH7_9ERIC|nr:AAA-ATPase [Camellia lanceoleosa]